MPLTKLITDAFGVLTISFVSVTAILGLLCIYCSLYFELRIKRRGSPQLSYFTGPWITRIVLILVAIWWGFGEVVRLTLLRRRLSLSWQIKICQFYILSNLGFAEPSILLMLAFLLHAALQKRESDSLSRRWNRRTVCCVLLFCLPLFLMQLVLVLVGPKFNNNDNNTKRTKMVKFVYYLTDEDTVCTYPLLSTIMLGVFVSVVISFVSFTGARLLSQVINKGLRRRIYLLMFSIAIFLPLRVLLLVLSIFPHPGNVMYEVIVFFAFFVVLFCAVVGICMLVYFPVADSLALRDIGNIEIVEIPYDDYYSEGVSLIANQSLLETGRNSDVSMQQGSASFRSMIKGAVQV